MKELIIEEQTIARKARLRRTALADRGRERGREFTAARDAPEGNPEPAGRPGCGVKRK